MTRFSMLVAALLVSANPATAEECKFKQNEVDVFTTKLMIETHWDPLISGTHKLIIQAFDVWHAFEVAGVREGNDVLLRFKVRLSDIVEFEPLSRELRDALWIPDGAPLDLVLADGSVVRLAAEKEVRPRTSVQNEGSRYQIRSGFYSRYALDDAAVAALMAQPVTAVGMGLERDYFEFDVEVRDGMLWVPVHENSMDDIRKALACVDAG